MSKRGRPALPDDEKRIRRGINLSPQAWGLLGKLAEQRGVSQNQVVEQLIRDASQPLP